jgi:AraC family transcriptional regulator
MITGPAVHRENTSEAHHVAVVRAIQHMRENLADPLDLEQLAQIALVSKFHFVRVFDELTGTTPLHFLSCLRVQRAKELLLRSDASITDICMEVGYASLGSFSKTFNSLVGLSPQEFRALPKRMNALEFAGTIWRYLASRRKFTGPKLEGVIEGPPKARGFIFVGAFNGGVPQGVPDDGTILLKPGVFRIRKPSEAAFHLLAVLVPFSASLGDLVTNLPVELVASLRVQNDGAGLVVKPCLHLRPLRPTDPPIVLALPALPPLRAGNS